MDDVHVFLRRGDAALALFLEAVKDKHGLRKLDGVHGAVGATHIVFLHLKHPCATKAFERFGYIVLVARLRQLRRKLRRGGGMTKAIGARALPSFNKLRKGQASPRGSKTLALMM